MMDPFAKVSRFPENGYLYRYFGAWIYITYAHAFDILGEIQIYALIPDNLHFKQNP